MPIPVEFILFGLTLLCVAIFHRHTLWVAVAGLAVIVAYKLVFSDFHGAEGFLGLWWHLQEEAVIVANLFLLLVGFALLSRHFEESRLPQVMPRFLPDGWMGGFVLLALVFVMSAFLDNIAAAIIGATMASVVFRRRLHIGYLAAIVASANAGGSGSVLGDTTTTMMWLAGKSPLGLLPAYIAAVAAFFVFAIPAAKQQHRHSPIVKDAPEGISIDHSRIVIVVLILVAAVAANIYANTLPDDRGARFPYIGAAVIGVLLLLTPWRRPDWRAVPPAIGGAVFLLSLVLAASLMPVDSLPAPTAMTTLGLGYLSAVFDNIPLTKLALDQGGYDWAALAYAVGFGGSMIWFGSSAGVAVSNLFPEAKSVVAWVREGWHVAVGYAVGFIALQAFMGWRPS